MTLKEKIDETQAAYKVVKAYVDDQRYFAYLQGLFDAYELQIDNRVSVNAIPSDTSNS